MTLEQKNMELMQTLDDAWNSQDWDLVGLIARSASKANGGRK